MMTQIPTATRRVPGTLRKLAQEIKTLSQAVAYRDAEIRRLENHVAQLQERLARVEAAQNAHVAPHFLAEFKPRRLPPPGKTAMEMIRGQWPGEETTEELLAQLKELG